MRRIMLLVLVGLAATSGCGDSRHEVRFYSSVPVESPQGRLDGVAANFFNSLLGGNH